MFNLNEEALHELKAAHTSKEIYQQPVVWKGFVESLTERKDELRGFVQSIYDKHGQVRVIFTGAGTSAFAGDTLVPILRDQHKERILFEAIATTDIVSNPEQFLFKEFPTILVSFARSGNSPESMAAVKLGEQIVKDFYQVNITCNKDGQLAQNSKNNANSLVILTPEEAHDRGFAMTSSYTSMMIAAYILFANEEFDSKVVGNAENFVNHVTATVEQIIDFDFDRIVYLGSGSLGQLAHEAALKMLELTAGKVVAIHESSLGFRHGPKSILTDKSVVTLFMSSDPYTRKYDFDILQELVTDGKVKVVALTESKDEEVEKLADWTISVNETSDKFTNDFSLALLYVIFAQVLSLKKSIQLGITPDNPSPDGLVNRVVKGVTIYEK
ncbi:MULTISPECIES: SIS domain-containing protein [unclassified Oceanobacillus]|uniref:SIS domain-containing protein n=1 Tax=unclassified Oceanobacillus TaxID=2630292 RepID=UPI0012EC5690|nr:SIS domain-containing protein [Oceanobacillus sp. AG]